MKNFFILTIILSVTFIINNFAQDTGWEIVQSHTKERLNSVYFFDYQTGFACGESGVVLKSIDSGKTWQYLQSPVIFNLNDCFMFEPDCFIAVGDSGMGIGTYDGGDTWFVTNLWELNEDVYSVSFSRSQGLSYGVFGADSQTIIIGASINCSTVLNHAWGGLSGGRFWGAFMLTPEIGFVAGENSNYQPILGRTTDSGLNWDYVSFYLDGNEGRATGVTFTDSNNGYISALVWDGSGAIAKTIDNGNNWTTTFFNTPLWGISFPFSGASQVGYCVGDSGTVLKTYNAGKIWQKQVSGTSEKLNKVFFIDSDFGFAVGENGIILRTTTGGGTVTNIEDDVKQLFNFELQQNYPNPFNPTTTIKYSIPQKSNVSLKVYDILGNEVASLVNEEKSAGKYEVTWYAANLQSGVYFYRLLAGSFIDTKKMILIK